MGTQSVIESKPPYNIGKARKISPRNSSLDNPDYGSRYNRCKRSVRMKLSLAKVYWDERAMRALRDALHDMSVFSEGLPKSEREKYGPKITLLECQVADARAEINQRGMRQIK